MDNNQFISLPIINLTGCIDLLQSNKKKTSHTNKYSIN